MNQPELSVSVRMKVDEGGSVLKIEYNPYLEGDVNLTCKLVQETLEFVGAQQLETNASLSREGDSSSMFTFQIKCSSTVGHILSKHLKDISLLALATSNRLGHLQP